MTLAASDTSYNLRPLLVLNSYLCSRSMWRWEGSRILGWELAQKRSVVYMDTNFLNSTHMEGGALEGVRWGRTHSTDCLKALSDFVWLLWESPIHYSVPAPNNSIHLIIVIFNQNNHYVSLEARMFNWQLYYQYEKVPHCLLIHFGAKKCPLIWLSTESIHSTSSIAWAEFPSKELWFLTDLVPCDIEWFVSIEPPQTFGYSL